MMRNSPLLRRILLVNISINAINLRRQNRVACTVNFDDVRASGFNRILREKKEKGGLCKLELTSDARQEYTDLSLTMRYSLDVHSLLQWQRTYLHLEKVRSFNEHAIFTLRSSITPSYPHSLPRLLHPLITCIAHVSTT